MSMKTDLQSIQDARDEMQTALQEKGVTVGDDITTYADGIRSISTGSTPEVIYADEWLRAGFQGGDGTNLTQNYGFDNTVVNKLKVGNILSFNSWYMSSESYESEIISIATGSYYGMEGRWWYTKIYYNHNGSIEEFPYSYSLRSEDYFYGTSGDESSSGGGGLACFTADTLVATENGLIPIRDVKVDDMVYSMNENNEIELKPVDKLIEHMPKCLYNVVLDNETIRTTFSHPFYVEGVGKVTANKLQVGYSLKDKEGNLHIIKGVDVVEGEVEKVYEIRVKDNHTYFVGNTQILVYNEDSVL